MKDVLLLTVMVILLGLIASGAVRKMMGTDRVANPSPGTSPPASVQ